MKADIHPEYKPVLFRDLASGKVFLTRSTRTSDKVEKWEDGNEYPIIEVEISSESHPFYTGKQRIMDSAGRFERFNARLQTSARRLNSSRKIAPYSVIKAPLPLAFKGGGVFSLEREERCTATGGIGCPLHS